MTLTAARSQPCGRAALLAGLLAVAAALFLSIEQGRGHEDPGGEEPRRHDGLARRGAQRAADRACASPSRAATRRTPTGKEGLANFLAGMLDEGAGDLTSKQFQERMEEIAMRMSFEDCARCLLRQLRDADREPRQGRRAAGAGARQAALRCRRGRARARPAAGEPRLRRPRPQPRRLRAVGGDGLRRPSLRPAGQRHAGVACRGITRDDLAELLVAHLRRGQPERRGGRRHRCRRRSAEHARHACSGSCRPRPSSTPVPPTQPGLGREAEGDRDGRAAVGGALRPARHGAQGQGLHAGLRAQHHPRRRRHVVAAVRRRCARSAGSPTRSTPACSPTSTPRSSPAASPPRTRRSRSRST